MRPGHSISTDYSPETIIKRNDSFKLAFKMKWCGSKKQGNKYHIMTTYPNCPVVTFKGITSKKKSAPKYHHMHHKSTALHPVNDPK